MTYVLNFHADGLYHYSNKDITATSDSLEALTAHAQKLMKEYANYCDCVGAGYRIFGSFVADDVTVVDEDDLYDTYYEEFRFIEELDEYEDSFEEEFDTIEA